MNVNVEVLRDRVREHARERAEHLGQAFVEELRGNMPRKSGDMADSADVDDIAESSNGVMVRIIVRSEYARFQNDGTGIYGPEGTPIVPVSAKALAFDWPSGAVFSGARVTTESGGTRRRPGARRNKQGGSLTVLASVRGTEPTHFWERTLDAWPRICAEVA